MVAERRKKEEKAEVSNGNKSSNAEQFLPSLSWSVDPISNPKKRLCLVALTVGRRVQSSIPLPNPKKGQLVQVKLCGFVRGYFPAAPQSVTIA